MIGSNSFELKCHWALHSSVAKWDELHTYSCNSVRGVGETLSLQLTEAHTLMLMRPGIDSEKKNRVLQHPGMSTFHAQWWRESWKSSTGVSIEIYWIQVDKTLPSTTHPYEIDLIKWLSLLGATRMLDIRTSAPLVRTEFSVLCTWDPLYWVRKRKKTHDDRKRRAWGMQLAK